MIARLSDEDIDAAIAALAGANAEPERTYIKPLKDIGEELIESLQINEGIGLGLSQIDVLTRGFRPTDLVLVVGFAHSSKTCLLLTMIVNNPHKRILFASLDDPAPMLLAKLCAMHSGMSSERIETLVRDGDEGTKRLIRETIEKHLPNLVIVDESLSISGIRDAAAEAEKLWGAPPDCVCLDFVEMLQVEGRAPDDQSAAIKQKMNELKTWAKTAPYPIVAVHQGTRSGARPGDPISLLSLGYSGESQATLVLGVRRKRDKPELAEFERVQHADTVTVHLPKNKRPGGRCTHYNGIDFHIESTTGLIRPLGAADMAATAVRVSMDELAEMDF